MGSEREAILLQRRGTAAGTAGRRAHSAEHPNRLRAYRVSAYRAYGLMCIIVDDTARTFFFFFVVAHVRSRC